MTGFRTRQVLLWLALFGGACATAPPPPPPPVSFEQKMTWILQLEDQRILRLPGASVDPPAAPAASGGRLKVAPLPSAVPDLLRLLEDSEARVRRRAALAVGRVGLAEGVSPLMKLLSDADPDVRQMAAFALGLIGDRAAVEALVAALGDPSPMVQGRAAEALGLIGDSGAAPEVGKMVAAQVATEELARVGADDPGDSGLPAAEAFRLGVFALVRLRSYEALASAALAADGKPVTNWWPLAYALQRLEDRRALPSLAMLARAQGIYTRAFAARGLGALKDRDAIPVLTSMVTGWRAQRLVAISAARALGQIADPAAARPLIDLLRAPDTDFNLRVEIIDALGAMRAADAVPLLIDFIADPWPAVRTAVLSALSRIDAEHFILVLSGLDPDPHWNGRASLAAVLQTLDAEVALPRLEELLKDQDQRVVPAVLTAMTRLKAPGVERILTDHLKHDDPVVRMSAAANLGEVKPPGGSDRLAAAYKAWLMDTTYIARAAALAALVKYGREAAVPVLREALQDRDWAVRVRAATLLKDLDSGAPADEMRPAPNLNAAGTYSEPDLVNPTVSPHVFIDTDRGTIEIELAVLDAPQTSRNFMALARKGFFNGVGIHRVVPNFVVQDGDPRGDGEGGPGYTIRDELNMRPYLRGTVGMALDWQDTGGSQFFITHSPQPHLDARYTAFGTVVAGMEVVDGLRPWDVITRVRVWDGTTMTRR